MPLNCRVGEDSWDFLGLQGDQTSQFYRKSFLNIHWRDWSWSLSSNTLVTWYKELTHWKRPWCWEDWRQEEKRMTEDEMVGWHHQLNGHKIKQLWESVLDSEAWHAAVHGVAKSRTWLSDWTVLNEEGMKLFLARGRAKNYWFLLEMFYHCSIFKYNYNQNLNKEENPASK